MLQQIKHRSTGTKLGVNGPKITNIEKPFEKNNWILRYKPSFKPEAKAYIPSYMITFG